MNLVPQTDFFQRPREPEDNRNAEDAEVQDRKRRH
jgi:hypothetical protein